MLEDVVNVAIDFGSDSVDFHAVTGGEEDHFGKIGADFEAASVAMQARGMDREFLAQLNGGGFVAQAGNKYFHAIAFRPTPNERLFLAAASPTWCWLLIFTQPI